MAEEIKDNKNNEKLKALRAAMDKIEKHIRQRLHNDYG